MPIAFPCPGCKKTIKAKESLAGRKLPCPGCGHALTVPAAPTDLGSTGLLDSAPKVAAPSKPATTAAPANAAPSKPAVPATPAIEITKPRVATPAPQPAQQKTPELADVLPWDDEDTEFQLQPLPVPVAELPKHNPYVSPQGNIAKPKVLPQAAAAPLTPSLAFRAAASQPVWQRRMLFLFVLALIPLAFHVLLPDSAADEQRFEDTIASMAEEEQLLVADLLEHAEENSSLEVFKSKLFGMLPEQRLKDAFLAYDSKAHWFMAVGVSLLFMGLLCAMAMDGSTQPWQLLAISAFTATGGIVLLLLFQYLADWSADGGFRGRGIVGLIFLIVKLIGYSYRAALTAGNGFLPSMLGFTFGVGLCEEFCKAMPLFAYFRNEGRVTWRGAMLWGLASGIGFGIAEGIMYSGDYYNGRAYAGIYFVRFFSCVALHAIWTAAVAITLYRRQAEWQSADELYEYAWIALKVIFIPMVLHGLYDTLLKQEYAGFALLTAVASFGYLGWLNYHCEKHE